MKVLLINPPSSSPQPIMPLGLAYLAASLEENNIPVEVIDAWAERLDIKSLRKRILILDPADLIGITVMSPTYTDSINTIRLVKESCPESKIIIGGTHPSSLPDECMRQIPEIDFAVAGEGDNLIVKLAKALDDKTQDLSYIKGLFYRDNNKIIGSDKTEPIKDLDSLPFPARHLFPSTSRYRTHPPYRLYNSYATMITSRGCPFRCSYCTKSVSGQNFRYQSPRRIIEEIKLLVDKYKIKQIHFYDDNFTINIKHIEEICDAIIQNNIKVLWSCVTRVDLVNEGLLKKMKQAGCWLISYGVESGNQKILDSVRKGYSIDQIKEVFFLTKKVGIRTLGYFMAGFPGETEETLDDTVKLSLFLDPDFVSWSITALYPGSDLYQDALDGKLGNNYRKLKTSIKKDSSNVSSLSPYAHGYTFIYDGDLPRRYILETVNYAYRAFYFRPLFIIRSFIRLRTMVEFLSYIQAFMQFLSWKIIKNIKDR